MLNKIKHFKIISKSLDNYQSKILLPGTSMSMFKNMKEDHRLKAKALENSLKRNFPDKTIENSTLKRFSRQGDAIQDDSLVITIGGDGLFLSASHMVKSKNVYMLGLNSHPNSSVGHYCSVKLPYCHK